MKRTLAIGCAALLSAVPLFAQAATQPAAPTLPTGTVTVDSQFVSNYVFRGADLMIGKAQQDGKSYGAHTGAMAFQPSITYATPIEGLSFNLWGSFAMQGRGDKDTDQLFEKGPAATGSNIIASGTHPATAAAPLSGTAIATMAPSSGNVPGFYKEPNGTHRVDEFDFTLGYDNKTTAGRLIFGYIAYTLNNPAKGSGGIIVNEAYYGNEMYVGYGLKGFEDLTLTLYGDTRTGSQYWKLGYASEYEISKTFILNYGVSAGYGVKQVYVPVNVIVPVATTTQVINVGMANSPLEGWQDVTATIGAKYKVTDKSAFKIGINVAYRPDLRFVDLDNTVEKSQNLPLWIDGGSTISDGKVADPAKNNGYINSIVNGMIQTQLGGTTGGANPNFAYAPRQNIPKVLWWVNVGYTMDF